MRILYHNEVDIYPAAEYSSERANFPASNVRIHHLAVPWRTSAVAGQHYILDAGAGNTITADCAAIAAHNLSSGATVKIQGHPTNAWGGPDVDETLVWDSGVILGFFTSASKRFWRFYLDDAANPDGYLEIGRLGLGECLQMPPIEPGVALPVADTTVVSTTPSGQAYVDRGILVKAPAFALPIVSQAERVAINAMWTDVGKGVPVFLAVWEDSLDVEPALYCRINQDRLEFQKAAEAGVLYSLDLEFLEVK